MAETHLILFLGASWWGADSRALGAALRRGGCALIEVDRLDYFPIRWESRPLKVLRRLIAPLSARDYNRAILRHTANPAIEFVLVCKGSNVFPSTLQAFRARGIPLYCFYPDVSFFDHGREIWHCLPLYDSIFTTKSFHLTDARVRARAKSMLLVSHGYDCDVHRALQLPQRLRDYYGCHVSFVGAWSPKKERVMATLLHRRPDLRTHLWGPSWWRAGATVRALWMGRAIRGDELALQYASAKINLGILSEAGTGTPSGDQVTTRTWHIPACGGFLLHEETPELGHYFKLGVEVATFGSEEQLVAQVDHFLRHEQERQAVAAAGHARCVQSGYSYDAVAGAILRHHAQAIASPIRRAAGP